MARRIDVHHHFMSQAYIDAMGVERVASPGSAGKAEAFTALLRSSRIITDRVSVFAEYGYLHDSFAGIESRNAVEGGLVYAIVHPQPHQLELDAGIGYAHESRSVGDSTSTPQALVGGRYKYTLSDTAEITDEVNVTASLSDSEDWRAGNVAAIIVKMASIFSLKLSNNLRYVNASVPGFETTDTITSIALVAKF